MGFCTLLLCITFENFSLIVAQNVTNNPGLEEQTNNTKTSISISNISSKSLSYENPDYNFKIKYPGYLEVSESDLLPNQVVKFTLTGKNMLQKSDVEISVYVYPGYAPNTSVSNYKEVYESHLDDLQEKGEMRLISSNISNVAGNVAINVVYYDYRNFKSLKDNEITFFDNGEKFLILYSTQPALFNTYLNDFREMLDSFKITLVSNNTNNISTIRAIDEYANYFASVTEGSGNLTGTFQDEISLWQSGEISNNTMAELTNQYLNKFISQLQNFNKTASPSIFENTKESMVSSFANEIKSYEFFRDYLLTGNETKNDIATNYLTDSLEDETTAFKAFKEVFSSTS